MTRAARDAWRQRLSGIVFLPHGGVLIFPGYWLVVTRSGYCISGGLN